MYRGRDAGVAHARRDEKIDWMREYSKARQNSYQMSEKRLLRSIASTSSGHHKRQSTPRPAGDYFIPLETREIQTRQ
jgi:hypothetical protein